MEQMDDIVKEFLVESYENLDQLDSDLLELEEVPDDRDKLASIFRTIHTIKGTSGFLAFPKLEHLTHVGENLLVPLRDGELRLTNDIADGLLGMVDAVRQMLQHIESNGTESDADNEQLLEQLEQLKSPSESQTASNSSAPESSGEDSPESVPASVPDSDLVEESVEQEAKIAPSAEITSGAANANAQDSESRSSADHEKSHTLADTTVRLDVQLLDRLMNLVGELVLARNQILQFSHETDDPSILIASQRLNHITTELQEGVMKTRMQPIRNAWSKLPRVVRDLANGCRKQVEVKMEGAETELDKTILEAIKDPLTHIVRNSVDHGIEPPEEREASGKPACGTLWLRAFHEGGQVNVEIADDGGGINVDRVKEKAIANGLATQEQVAEMNDRELTNLILLPGFSTAQKVTNVSGRGVGMDVVKTNVERIGGTLDIQSFPGQGTTLRIKIPLTLAIVPALIVSSGGNQFAIPQVSLLELVRLDGVRAKKDIERIHSVPVYRLRGDLLPLVDLNERLELESSQDEEDHVVNIVVLQAEDRQFGLIVDDINDTQEIVVKPLGHHLKNVSAYAGATIMGDGTVALILDVMGIAQQGKVLSEHHEMILQQTNEKTDEATADNDSLLIVDPGDGSRAAIPLSSVARLEEFDPSKIEQVDRGPVVQYRGDIMPLVGVDGSIGFGGGGNEPLQVVVHSRNGRDIGVLVGSILDIVVEPQANNGQSQRIIDGHVTRIVDLASALAHVQEFAA